MESSKVQLNSLATSVSPVGYNTEGLPLSIVSVEDSPSLESEQLPARMEGILERRTYPLGQWIGGNTRISKAIRPQYGDKKIVGKLLQIRKQVLNISPWDWFSYVRLERGSGSRRVSVGALMAGDLWNAYARGRKDLNRQKLHPLYQQYRLQGESCKRLKQKVQSLECSLFQVCQELTCSRQELAMLAQRSLQDALTNARLSTALTDQLRKADEGIKENTQLRQALKAEQQAHEESKRGFAIFKRTVVWTG